ncbi:MAG TPA: 2-hydroxyacyl-CoA dehydratase family protein [Acidimicrobiales bacterium]|nr:2-hydroxyacyl-CoA dehydratase family protein [Acidimicrobiales bacterium]
MSASTDLLSALRVEGPLATNDNSLPEEEFRLLPGPADWLDRATHAYRHPDAVAREWREGGGRVVGVLGHDVPRELVLAAGLLPIRLAPARLLSNDAPVVGGDSPLQLTPDCQAFLDALLAGALGWIDALVIGRDSESHTKLFYGLRELLAMGEAPRLDLCFYDLVRLPTEASARYNRVRTRQFAEVLATWSGAAPWQDAMRASVAASNATTTLLEELADLRRARPAGLGGVDALLLDGAAMTLAPGATQDLLTAALADPPPPRPGRRVFVSGSPHDDLALAGAIEGAGYVIVGEDHDWGDRSFAVVPETADPLDGLVDRYHLGPPGAARTGLDERARYTCHQALARGAEVVLQLCFDHDESPEWEFPDLRDRLAAHGVPVVRARLPWPGGDPGSLARLAQDLSTALDGPDG